MNGFIYKITNRVNNKVYIGQTHFTVEHRFKQHVKNYNIEHRKQALYKAFAKYGLENFTVETVEEVDAERLNEREMYWIAYYDSFKNGYNANCGGNGNIYIWTDSQYEEIRTMYLSGFTSQKIAELYGVSSTTILGILKSLRVKIKGNPMDMNDYEAQELIKEYEAGATLNEIARRYNTDKMAVRRFLVSKGAKVRKRSLIQTSDTLQEEMVKDFASGMRLKDLENKYHSDVRTLKRILVERGVDLNMFRGIKKTTKGSFCLPEEACTELIDMYNQMVPVRQIAEHFNIDISTVYDLLKQKHVKPNRYNSSKSVPPRKV